MKIIDAHLHYRPDYAPFAATAAISGLGVLAYRKITQHHQRKERERQALEQGVEPAGKKSPV